MSSDRHKGIEQILRYKDRVSRRQFLRAAGLAGATLGAGGTLGGVLTGCGGSDETTDNAAGGGTGAQGATTSGGGAASGRELKIGYVTPLTGALAGFGEADNFTMEGIKAALTSGITVGNATHPVSILVKDSQSDPDRAATVAGDLIADGVDILLVSSTPETTNPVSDQAEANGMPCIATVCPWQAWFFARKGDPGVGFEWTYLFFWGLEDVIGAYTAMWEQVRTNKIVGGLFPNDGDGNAWGDPKTGFPPTLKEKGYTFIDPGRYQNGTEDFSAQISQFKNANVEILTGVPIPPDFTNFWKQASQQGFRPKIATIGKALDFPSSVEALGDLADGLTLELSWAPSFPFKSSLTGETPQQFAEAYRQASGKQWNQYLGFCHALFEVATDVFKRTTDVDNPSAIRDAIASTNMDTLVGKIDWASKDPVPNVSKTPMLGGQWGPGTDFKYDLKIVTNTLSPNIPTQSSVRPVPYK